MATRPIFFPCAENSCNQLVHEEAVEFKWTPGIAVSQKRKNILSLHKAAEEKRSGSFLDISTKSDQPLGVALSAFNLRVQTKNFGKIPLETAYQGSKVFERGGPYADLYGKSPFIVKKDERLRTGGRLVKFIFEDVEWNKEPKTAFYDWLYINALHGRSEIVKDLKRYSGYSDIEFNPKKSLNCQARACALYLTLLSRGQIEEVLLSKNLFLDLLTRDSFYQSHSREKRQATFWAE